MPLAVATWLVEKTTLTFEQIGDFCGIHPLDVSNIGGIDPVTRVLPVSPIGIFLTLDEIERCSKDPSLRLQMVPDVTSDIDIKRPKVKKYVSLSQRRSRLDAALWLCSFCSGLSDSAIADLVNSTPKTVSKIRNGSYRGVSRLVPKSPVVLGLCTKSHLDIVIASISSSSGGGSEKK